MESIKNKKCTIEGCEGKHVARGRMNNGDKLRFSGEGKSYVKVNQRHEHRTVAECMLGRKLKPDEVVHHINRNKRDNRPENLEVLTRREHMLEHLEEMKNAKAKKLSAKNV